MAKSIGNFLGKIHHSDCVDGLKQVPAGSVDLAFADPPFNIGYEYDEYDDRLECQQYLDWSRSWIAEVHRVLKDNGAFWLAIGDEYAAELKLESQRTGFHCRSWVIWYYTFGVHCQKKFTRSHAHLFHFVKDATDYVFNSDDPDLRVPSARQLVYNDKRANSKGRMPDDTWILRPQDLTDGFNPDEDTWYFPRVAGTFKERSGFHGCQMPEQLLGRILRACSSKNDIVLDPFSGSSTTLAVAKKLDRRFFGFELSKDYVKLGKKRLDGISVGDELDGSREPKVSAPATIRKKTKRDSAADRSPLPLFPELRSQNELAAEAQGILEAFAASNRGYSVDRLIADPILNEDFQLACQRKSIPGTPGERNRFLFRLRKAGKIKAAGIDTTMRTSIDWDYINPFVFASEIAWRQIANKYCDMSLDEIFCDPRIAVQFDKLSAGFAPGYEPLDYRWAALKLRKEGSKARHRATTRTARQLEITSFKKSQLKNAPGAILAEVDFAEMHRGPGVYLVQQSDGKSLFAGEAQQLRRRLETQFDPAGPQSLWLERGSDLLLHWLPVSSTVDYRLARQSLLLKWYQPQWNQVENLAC